MVYWYVNNSCQYHSEHCGAKAPQWKTHKKITAPLSTSNAVKPMFN